MGRNATKPKRRLTSKPARPEPSRTERLRAYLRRNLSMLILTVLMVGALIWRVFHWLGYIHAHHFQH